MFIAVVSGLGTALAAPALIHDDSTMTPSPIPENEKNLPTVVAEPYFKVSDKGLQLEGLEFDRNGIFFLLMFGAAVYLSLHRIKSYQLSSARISLGQRRARFS